MTNNKILKIPHSKSVRYTKNLIVLAVCELRFPTIMGFENDPPIELQKKLRNQYPLVETFKLLTNTGPENKYKYSFFTKSQDWVISIASNSLSLDTSAYTEFKEFSSRLKHLIDISKNYINSPLFTRVGLRYINHLPVDNIVEGKMDDLLNQELLSMLPGDQFGSIDKYLNEIRGYTKAGKYTFKHGWETSEQLNNRYILDFDYYDLDVEYNKALDKVMGFHKINFDFFKWCLGKEAIKLLGKTTKKGKKS